MSAVIEVKGLVKKYGELEAVRGIDLTVEQGEVVGFLGPNGAGKTTTISILCTLLRPTAGDARVAGVDVSPDPAEVRRRIGLVFQEPSLDVQVTARSEEHTSELQSHSDLVCRLPLEKKQKKT